MTALNDTITYGSAQFKVVKNLTSNNINDYLGDVNVSGAVVASDAPVGYITWQMHLMKDYLKLDGTPLADASNDYADLLKFAQGNELITEDTTDKSLFKYDSTTDVLTLPNYIDLVLQGGNTVDTKEAGLPNIKGDLGWITSRSKYQNSTTGPLYWQGSGTSQMQITSGTAAGTYVTFDASRSNSIYKDSVNTVQPPAITLIPQIKYKKTDVDSIFYNDSPIGTIIAYMGITAPKDYLACDGQTYNIVDYKELAEYIKVQFGSYNYFGGDGTTTFAVPDLRGEFLRGTGTNSHTNQGNGDSVGTHQDGTEHVASIAGVANSLIAKSPTAANLFTRNIDKSIKTSSSFYLGNSSTYDTNYVVSYTSRPTNTSVLYCIKYNTSVLSTPENNYSTEEQRIGTWIDGKPLYQKTYNIITPSTVDTLEKVVNFSDNTIDVKNIEGYFISNTYPHHIPINIYTGTSYAARFEVFDPSSYGIMMKVSASSWSSCNAYITLQYTKTTD